MTKHTEKPATKLDDTGERMVPEYHQKRLIYAEHWTRYDSAKEVAAGKVVLDIASGSGYGTKLLGSVAKHVYGVDISPEAVTYAKENFGGKNIEFLVGDGQKIPLDDNTVDVVITFETIEHIKDYGVFLAEVKRVLRPGGLAIVSTPNDLEFAEGNHFHLHEFEQDELMSELGQYFAFTKPYFQATWKSVMIGDQGALETEGPIDVPVVNLAAVKPEQVLYFYILCSDVAIQEDIKTVVALGEHYSDRAVMAAEVEHDQAITRLMKDIGYLNATLTGSDAELKRLRAEISAIKNSRTFKMARRMAHIKNKITGQ